MDCNSHDETISTNLRHILPTVLTTQQDGFDKISTKFYSHQLMHFFIQLCISPAHASTHMLPHNHDGYYFLNILIIFKISNIDKEVNKELPEDDLIEEDIRNNANVSSSEQNTT